MCDEAELRQVLGEAFDQCDADKSGFLDKGEILKVLNSYNSSAQCKHKKSAAELDKDAKEFIAEVDANNDGKITKKEFLDFFIKLFK